MKKTQNDLRRERRYAQMLAAQRNRGPRPLTVRDCMRLWGLHSTAPAHRTLRQLYEDGLVKTVQVGDDANQYLALEQEDNDPVYKAAFPVVLGLLERNPDKAKAAFQAALDTMEANPVKQP